MTELVGTTLKRIDNHNTELTGEMAAPGVRQEHDMMEADNESEYSASGSEIDSNYTESLRSSLLQSVTENGRGYHKYRQGKYILPEDEQERDRLDFQHQLFNLTFSNNLILAPVTDELRHVLDIGTGTGVWAIDFADQHPEASVIGMDLSAIQPTSTPPNCKFEIDDVEEPWTYPQKFDLIHSRMMSGSILNVPRFFAQAFAATKPGGWIEMQDISFPAVSDDHSLTESHALARWSQLMIQASEKTGRGLTVPHRYKGWMEQAGFVDCVEIVHKWPMNPWPKDAKMKELGRWGLVNMLDGLYGFSVALFTRVLGMRLEDMEVFLVDVKKDIQNKKVHSYWPIHVVYGRKPRAA